MLPDISTFSRILATADERCVQNIRRLCRELIAMRAAYLQPCTHHAGLRRLRHFTKRHAENSAVGYNKKHKGWRSYYPLFCNHRSDRTDFDLLHRPGNVHDSHDALAFIASCIDEVHWPYPALSSKCAWTALFSARHRRHAHQRSIQFTVSVHSNGSWNLNAKSNHTTVGLPRPSITLSSRKPGNQNPGTIQVGSFVRTKEAIQSKETHPA